MLKFTSVEFTEAINVHKNTKVVKESGLRSEASSEELRPAPNEKLSNSNGTFVLLILIFNSRSEALQLGC